jgi:hypothetical protein
LTGLGKSFVCALLGGASAIAGAGTASAQFYPYAPECDRACLTGHLDAYLAAQAANDASGLPFADDVRVTENGVDIAPGEGIFRTADEPTFRLDVVDPEMGAVATNLVVKEGDAHAFEMVRLKVAGGEITEVETIVGREGESGPMFVPDFATEPSREFLLTLVPSDQNSRLELMATADAYWRALETNGEPEYNAAPLLPGALRIENGLATTNGSQPGTMGGNTPSGAGGSSASQQFDTGVFVSRTIYDRRFPVVDVERGLVLSIARMGLEEGYDMPAHWQGGRPVLAEIFAIQDGKITAINVVMKSTIPLEQSMGWPRDPLTRSKSDPN